MNFEEAVIKSLPGFHEAILKNPDHLIVLGVIPHDPTDPDGPGRIHVVGHPDTSKLVTIEEVVEVIYYYRDGYIICPKDGKVYTLPITH